MTEYRVSLADLILIASAASELDGCKDHLADKPAERARIAAMVEAVHEAVERAAAADACIIYAPDDATNAEVSRGAQAQAKTNDA